jgi:hypothetical protein
MSAAWEPGVSFTIHGVEVQLQNLVRDAIIVGLALTSLTITKKEYRAASSTSRRAIKGRSVWPCSSTSAAACVSRPT